MDYQTLDKIADLYTPMLALITIAVFTKNLVQSWPKAWIIARPLGCLSLSLMVAYGLMWLDQNLHLWPMMRLDYSTHTAVALVFIAILGILLPRQSLIWFTSLMLYLLLMLYQRYHTVGDIFSTGLVVGSAIALIKRWLLGNSAQKPDRSTERLTKETLRF